MKSLNNYINEQLHIDLCCIYNNVNENNGLYDGQLELASLLANDIEKYINENKNVLNKYDFEKSYNYDDLKEFKNIFFNNLILELHIAKNKSLNGYSDKHINKNEHDIYKKYNYDILTKRLNLITITLNMSADETWDNIRGRIIHELNHLYTYYNIICDDFNETAPPKKYHNILDEWANTTYSKITEHLYFQKSLYDYPNEYYITVSHLVIYSLTRFERNAFLAEIVSYLFDRKGAMKNINNLENELSKCNQYNIYDKEFDILYNNIITNWSDSQKNILKNTYNNIYNKKEKSFSNVLKILKHKNNETKKKLNENIKALCQQYKDVPMYTTSYPFESQISFTNPKELINFF